MEWAAPALPDFPTTLPSILRTPHGWRGLRRITVISVQRPPRDRNLDTRQRDFCGDSLGTGTDEGVPDLARLEESVTPRDLDGNRSLQRAVGEVCIMPDVPRTSGPASPESAGAPTSRNHASALSSDPSSGPASVPPSGHHRSTRTCANPQVRGDEGSSVYWSDSLRCVHARAPPLKHVVEASAELSLWL